MTTSRTEKEINFYEELALNPNAPTNEINKALKILKRKWEERSGLSGQNGKTAQETIRKIAAAEKVFQDDDTRASYDEKINGTQETTSEPNWTLRAWNYLFADEHGAATIAARNARSAKPQDALTYIVSAWVEVEKGEYGRAKEYIDEAFVHNEDEGNIYDIQYLRGATYYAAENYEKSIESFTVALDRAPTRVKPQIYTYKAAAYQKINDPIKAIDMVLRGLESDPNISTNYENNLRLAGVLTLAEFMRQLKIEKTLNQRNEKAKEQITKIVSNIKSSNARTSPREILQEYAELVQKWINLSESEKPRNDWPDFPLFSLIAAGVLFLILTGFPNAILFILWVASASWSAYRIYSRVQIKQRIKEYNKTQSIIANIENRMEEISAHEADNSEEN